MWATAICWSTSRRSALAILLTRQEETGEQLSDKAVKLALDEIAAGEVVYRPGPRTAPVIVKNNAIAAAMVDVDDSIDLDEDEDEEGAEREEDEEEDDRRLDQSSTTMSWTTATYRKRTGKPCA